MSDKTDLAEDRTDWAEDRTALANERTFAGWLRTGMASLGIAIAIEAIFNETQPTWLAKSAASLFVGAGICVFVAAYVKSCRTAERLTAHASHPMAQQSLLLITFALISGAIGVGALLWMI